MCNLQTAVAKETSTDIKILVLIDSRTGGALNLAKLVAEGIQRQEHTKAIIKRVPDVGDVGNENHSNAEVASLPVATVEELPSYDAIAWGSPIYFGNVSANMKKFMDGMLSLWSKCALDGVPTSVFMSAGSGVGKESALTAFIHGLAMHGMTIVTNGMLGTEQLDNTIPQGNTPFGITSLTSMPGKHPTQGESIIAGLQGTRLAKIAVALKETRSKTALSVMIDHPKTSEIETRLKTLGIHLPPVPTAAGNYKPYSISNKQVYINQVALRNNVILNPGIVRKDVIEEQAKLATEQTILNILAVLKEAAGGDLGNVKQTVQLTGYFNTVAGYQQHANLLNVASDILVVASDILVKVFGEAGKHACASIGSSSLPLNSAVEIQAIFELK